MFSRRPTLLCAETQLICYGWEAPTRHLAAAFVKLLWMYGPRVNSLSSVTPSSSPTLSMGTFGEECLFALINTEGHFLGGEGGDRTLDFPLCN